MVVGALTLAGCSDSFNAGPLKYVESERLTTELQEKPKLQVAVRNALAKLFGEDPQQIRVPAGSGLFGGGIRLGSSLYVEAEKQARPIAYTLGQGKDAAKLPQEGGYALYRRHCLHCHGVSGAGDGPTAPFLYPRPRDYRKGLFKFTSTPTGAKPTRSDLRKTLLDGIHGTSMPAFVAMLNDAEIEQVLDYVIFLSMRGETELALIDEAMIADESDPDALSAETAGEIAQSVFNKWKSAETQVLNPPIPKPPSTRESILRGKELFLGLNKTGNKVDCTSCHGPQATGNGPSFIDQKTFNEVVFDGDPSTMPERIKDLDEKQQAKWKESLDDWGNPLRPANLNLGVYKGGRRPIDLYWRIAKGINGAKMPAHFPTIEPEKIWDLVNFVQALPYEPDLLKGATLPAAPPATAPKVAVAR
jgi:mono/diheme cytochrome c family protein